MLNWLEGLFYAAVAGALALLAGLWMEGDLGSTLVGIGIALMVPVFIYLYLIPIWHWKSRYRGDHSLLWGAMLILETSGWFKIVYWFRHVLPDIRARGRYFRRSTELTRS